jgi:hypothetical protein
MERYDNVIALPLQLRGRADVRARRRPRAPAAVAASLREHGDELFEAAVAHGLVAREGTADEEDVIDGVEAEDAINAVRADGARAEGDGVEDGGGGDVGEDGAVVSDTRTKAEREFAEIAARRERERLRRQAALSHKQQIDKFNKSLAAEPEHYDLFRVSHTK